MFKTLADRNNFMKAYGVRMAGVGGLFGAYKDATEAFQVAKGFKPYLSFEIGTDKDFKWFEIGFNEGQTFRIVMQKSQADAQAFMSNMLKEGCLEAPNYLYENKA